MEYLVTMTTHVPEGTPAEAVADVRAREAARSAELAAQGHLRRLWVLPEPGRTPGLWRAEDAGQMEAILKSLPLQPSVLTALTKGGLAAATRSLAVEYASRGVRVNAVSPGIIQTPIHPADSYDGLGDQLPPLGRVGQVSDVVDGILYLESASYITGENLHIDGGQTAGH